MHPLKVSCVGQTFALARCGDPHEKKTRRRRSKEERKTMVESFIKKYRNSNNGNFPSLNITHKEVGGSYYTVREIVREIIQENKVLGPGSLALKALNLESCTEEHIVGSFSMDPHGTVQNYMENYSPSAEHQIISEESFELIKSESPKTFASHPNDCPVSQILHTRSSDHLDQNSSATYVDVNSASLEFEEANLRKSTHVNSEGHGLVYPEVQSHNPKDCNSNRVKQSVPLLKSISVTNPSKGLGMNESDIGINSDSMVETSNSLAENLIISDVTGTNILSETKILSNAGNNCMSAPFQEYSASNASEVFPLASTAAKICSSDRRPLEAGDLTSSLEVFGTHNFSNEVEVASMPVDEDPVGKRTEPTEGLSSSSINDTPAVRLMSPLSRTFVTTKLEPQLVVQPSDIDTVVINDDSAVCESPSSDIKAEYEDSAINCDRGSISSSISSEKPKEELDQEEINPVWAAVKAFVTAVIKFWTD